MSEGCGQQELSAGWMSPGGWERDFRRSLIAAPTPVVFVIDQDASVRESLETLIGRAGWRSKVFSSAEEFLAHPRCQAPSCLVMDVALPGLTGLELQRLLADRSELPIVFMTKHADIPTTVQAMKSGAVEFLTKPFDEKTLTKALWQALEHSCDALDREAQIKTLRERYVSLSLREREVMVRVVGGRLNKQIGVDLGISIITVKSHRGRLMRKMSADSLAELVGMAAALDLDPVKSQH
jgi:FixJ family two-component response regulator